MCRMLLQLSCYYLSFLSDFCRRFFAYIPSQLKCFNAVINKRDGLFCSRNVLSTCYEQLKKGGAYTIYRVQGAIRAVMPDAIIPPLNGRPTSDAVKARQVDRSRDRLDRHPLLCIMKKPGPLGSPFHGDSLWISINLCHSIRSLSSRCRKSLKHELIVEKKRQ